MDTTTDDVMLTQGRTRENQQEMQVIPERSLEEMRALAKKRSDDATSSSPSFSAAGPTIIVSWSNIAYPNSGNWIGLYKRSGPMWDITTWAYTDGHASGSGYLTVPTNAVPGPYDMHLFFDEAMQRLSMGDKLSVHDRAAVAIGSNGPFSPGHDLSPTWAAESHTAADWIALAPFGAPDGTYLAYTYTNGAASGSAKLLVPAGTKPGEYELRLFSNDGFERMATAHVTVTHPTAWIGHNQSNTDTVALLPGSQLLVNWSGIPAPANTDWFGLFPLGATDHEYAGWLYTNGAAAGSAPFTIPAGAKPGRYELRLFPGNSYNVIATSDYHLDIEVGNGTRFGNFPASGFPACHAGEAIGSWQNVWTATATDWIGLYHRDAPASDYLAWKYTGGGSYGYVHLPLPAGLPHGDYELRMYSNNGYQLIGFDLLFL